MSVYVCTPRVRMGRLVVSQRLCEPSQSGDWGNLDEHDWKMNDDGLEFGGRLLSEYFAQDGTKFWIVTECDRSVTTVLLPKEY